MKLSEFLFAIEGFNDLEEDRVKWQFYCARKICYFIAKTTGNDISEADIIPIVDIDKELENLRADLPLVQVIQDGPNEQ